MQNEQIFVISTQLYENYAAHDWGGMGECPQLWKAKGGMDYKITNVPDTVTTRELLQLCEQVGVGYCDNEFYREYHIHYQWADSEWLTPFERDQLVYDGHIQYPAPQLEYGYLVFLKQTNRQHPYAD